MACPLDCDTVLDCDCCEFQGCVHTVYDVFEQMKYKCLGVRYACADCCIRWAIDCDCYGFPSTTC